MKNIGEIKRGSKIARNEKRKIIEYYTENIDRMKYKTFRDKNMMIGSGPIEAAHIHVIQQRMKYYQDSDGQYRVRNKWPI